MDILGIAILTLVASFAGTASGFGTSTIMVPVLALLLPPVEAIFLVSVIHWFGNVWKVLLFRTGFDPRLIALFGVPGALAAAAGALITFDIDPLLMVRTVGIVLAVYAVTMLLPAMPRVPARPFITMLGGALSGFLAGLVGFGGAVRGMFLSAYRLPAATYISTAGAIGLVVDSARVIGYIAGGVSLDPRLARGLLVFLPVSFVGAHIAQRFVGRLSPEAFQKVLAAMFLVVALRLLVAPP